MNLIYNLKNSENSFIVQVGLVIILRLLLDYSYFYLISPKWSYMGFKDNQSMETLFLSWGLVIASIIFYSNWIKEDDTRNSNILILFIYYASFLPITTCINAGVISRDCILQIAIYYFFLFSAHQILWTKKISKRISLRLNGNDLNSLTVEIIVSLMMVIVVYISYIYTNFRFNFDFSIVYTLRNEARNFDIPALLRYCLSNSRAILPMAFGSCILKKKYVSAGIIWFVQILSFGIDGVKSVFLIPIVIIGFVLFFERFEMKNTRIILLFIMLLISSIFAYFLFDSMWISDRLVRRGLFIPAFLNEIYFVFFETHDFDYFHSSFLRHFGVSSIYSDFGGISRAIGVFLGKPDMAANNGLYSDAVANLGIIGVFLMPMLLSLIFRFFDLCTMGIDKRLVLVVAIQMSYSFMGSFLGTALLTHGILLTMILMCLIRRDMKQCII